MPGLAALLRGVSKFCDVTLVYDDQTAVERHQVLLSAKNPFKWTKMEDEFWSQASGDGTTPGDPKEVRIVICL